MRTVSTSTGIAGLAILALLLGPHSRADEPPVGSQTDSPALIAKNNRAVALMGQRNFRDAQRLFQELADLHPDWHDIQVNLAIATMHVDVEETSVSSILDRVLLADPRHIRARFVMGLTHYDFQRHDEALPYFYGVSRDDPRDAYSTYLAGTCLQMRNRHDEALIAFDDAHSRNPYLASALYGKALTFGVLGRRDDRSAAIKTFLRINSTPLSVVVDWTLWGRGANATPITVDLADHTRAPTPAGSLFANPIPVTGPRRPHPRNWSWSATDHLPQIPLAKLYPQAFDLPPFDSDLRPSPKPSLTCCDVDGDGTPEVFAASAVNVGGAPRNALLTRTGDGDLLVDLEHPLSRISNVNAVLWGDVDNDGLVDAYFCRRGANQLWRQTEPGKWIDATAATGCGGESFDTLDGALVDVEHDGDLDIVAIRADGPTGLWIQRPSGTFLAVASEWGLRGDGRPSRGLVAADLDRDRDLDLIVLKSQPPHEVFLNDLTMRFVPAEGYDELRASPALAAVAGDVDADGQVEIYTAGPRGHHRWTPGASGQWNCTQISPAPATDSAHLTIADLNGDGIAELLSSCDAGLKILPALESAIVPSDRELAGVRPHSTWLLVNLSPERGPALVAFSPGLLPVLLEPGPGRHAFCSLALEGRTIQKNPLRRTNASAIGATTRVRIGSTWTTVDPIAGDSSAGQSLQPAAVGTIGAPRIDFIAIEWPDGVRQTELDLTAGRHHRVEEIERLVGW